MCIACAAAEMLDGVILPFWMALRDNLYGGYYGYMDFDLKLKKNAPKGCVLNSRILWFFSEAAILTGRMDLREYATHAYHFLEKYCLDHQNGGMYWSITCNQAFAIYALSSYYHLTGKSAVLRLACNLFDLIEHRCTDTGGYCEAFIAK